MVLVLLPLLLGLAFPQEATARGTVYEDLDGDGARDAGEPGIAGVRVSDGRSVVRTDAQGRYALAVEDEATIFVTKPAGHATPVSADGLPRFYYLHAPAGSPAGLRYPGIPPSGPLPEAIDFALRRVSEPDRFEVLLLADTQPQTQAELDWLRDDVLSRLVGTSARFGMTLGDVLFDDLSLFPRYVRLVGALGIPWHNVPGNHDVDYLAPDDARSLETFKALFGPPYYAFEVGQAVFFVLDNIEYQGRDESDPWGDGGYVVRLGARQLGWIEQELACIPPEKLIVLTMHSPLVNDDAPESKTVNTQDRADLLRLLGGREHLYVATGHMHTTEHRYLGAADGFPGPGTLHQHVIATASGSWWSGPLDARGIPDTVQRDGTPNGWHVLEVDGNACSARYCPAADTAEEQMRIRFESSPTPFSADVQASYRPGEASAGRISAAAASAATIVVNLFDGGPRSTVEFQVGDGATLPMQRAHRPDPYVVELHARRGDAFKSWVAPEPSTHLFVARLPADLGPGVHAVRVRARDEFGREHRAQAVLEISAP